MTSKRDELLALAERCEKATEGSRELDGLIWKAVCEKPGNVWMRQDPEDTVAYEAPPAYTTSLDAAKTLVPEGCGWVAGWGQTRPDEPMGGAQITPSARYNGSFMAGEVIAEAEAATPALALCAAALRAAVEMES